jgi:hypothetical protein
MSKQNIKVIAWWSGGITSAVACKLAIDMYGADDVKVVYINTHNEHEDTYRFKEDCEVWYDQSIEIISDIPSHFKNIQEVWEKNLSLNVAVGAICSYHLKRRARERWQKHYKFEHQVFGFDISEGKRALGMAKNNPDLGPVFPLLFYGYTKKNCIEIVEKAGIEIPETYKLGLSNNNCFQTGCVQGGIGYWQMIRDKWPDKFDAMAAMEHKLTDKKARSQTDTGWY